MKKHVFGTVAILLLCSLIFASCGRSTEELAEEVRASIEETFKERGMTIKINDFSLIKKSKNEYKGVLDVTYSEINETYTVSVLVDGDKIMWEIDNLY